VSGGWLLDHVWYALAWAAFGGVHSLLAADPVKRRLKPTFGAWYRAAYNAFATVHLAAVLALGWWLLDGTPFALPRWIGWAQIGVFVAGAAVFVHALRFYDLGRLGGLFQLYQARRGREEPDDEPLRTDGWHRYVRHPLYFAGLLMLWGGARSELGVATALWASLYLAIGAGLEERKLLRHFGRAYADYRARVPALIPWKGRAI
jgi:protein-S-isoprenylcysteine O-methyltransferase Ste14